MTVGLEKKQALLDKGASLEEIDAWEQHTRQKLLTAGATAGEVDGYFGVGPANTAALERLYPGESLRPSVQEEPQPASGPRRPTTIAEAWTAGQQMGLTGLAARGRAPDIALGDQEHFVHSITAALGTLVGDLPVVLPVYAATFVPGAKLGATAGGVASRGNPIATTVGAAAGGLSAGGFTSGFVSEQLRSAMLEFYADNEGRNVGRREFAVGVAAKALTQEVLARAFKEGVINAGGSLAGGPVAGKLAGANPFVRGAAVGAAELAGSVGLASAIEGELPDAREFGTMAAISIGAGTAGGLLDLKRKGGVDAETAAQVERRLKKMYKAGGQKPGDLVRAAEGDPIAREQLITGEGLTEADTTYADNPSTEERLRIPHEAVDAEYVDEGQTNWSKYSRALRGQREGDRAAPAQEVALFKGSKTEEAPATRADLDALLNRTSPSEKKRQVRDIDDFRFEVVDDLQYAKSFIAEAHKKATGTSLSPEQNPGELMATARGADAVADQHINRGVFARGEKKQIAPALKEVFSGLNASQQEALGAYFLAKRTLEKEGQGFETGMDVDAARRIVASAEKSSEVVKRRALKQEWDFAGVDWVVDSGLINQKSAEAIKAQNEDYVPFFALGLNDGREQATRGFSVRKPYKDFKGRDIKIIDPLEALVKNRFYQVRMAENNRAKLRYAGFNDALPASFRVMDRITPRPRAASGAASGTDAGRPIIVDVFPELTDADPAQLAIADRSAAKQKEILEKFEAAQYDPERTLVTVDENGNTEIVRLDDLARNTPSIKKFMDANGLDEADIHWLHVAPELEARAARNGNIVMFENGRPIVYRARDARLAKSFEHLTRGELNFVTKVLSAPARVVRTAITTWPTFVKASLIRDTVDAALINKFDFKPVISTIDGAVQTLLKSADFEQYVANGGAGAALVDVDADLRQISIAAFSKSKNPLEKVRNLASAGFSALYGVGATFDQFNRAAAFKQGVKEGLPPEVAALRGRKVSLDFAQAGASMYAWNSIMVFLGPSINGIDRARLAAMNPGHLALTATAYVMLPTLVLWAANAQEEWYQEKTSQEKARYWYFRVGGDASAAGAKVVKIEKPHAWVSLFSTTPELVLNHIHQKSNPKLARDLLQGFEREWLPPFGEVTATQPFFDVAANHDGFLDRAIVSRRLEQTILPEFRYTPYTSETAKALSKMLPDVVPERFRTPDGLDYLVNSFTGAQGENILNATERLLADAGLIKKVKTSRAGIMDSQLVRSVLEEGSRFRGTFDEFYSNTERARQTNGTFTELVRQGRLAEAQELQQKYGAYMVKAQQIELAVGTVFTQIRMVEFNQTIPTDQKKQLVRQYTSFAASMADAFNQQMRAIESAQEEQEK